MTRRRRRLLRQLLRLLIAAAPLYLCIRMADPIADAVLGTRYGSAAMVLGGALGIAGALLAILFWLELDPDE